VAASIGSGEFRTIIGDPTAAEGFCGLAKLSGGAYLPFDESAVASLKSLLGAVATYAAGGLTALETYSQDKEREVRLLTAQLRLTHK
jgi:hypothetical protein